jgi:hypothetical protein
MPEPFRSPLAGEGSRDGPTDDVIAAVITIPCISTLTARELPLSRYTDLPLPIISTRDSRTLCKFVMVELAAVVPLKYKLAGPVVTFAS